MEIAKQNNFNELITNVYQTHRLLQLDAQKAVNVNLTMRNWLIGCYIVEFEQNGEDRAKYGERLIEEMSKKLTAIGLKGYSPMALRNSRKFYKIYPQLWQTVFSKLQHIGFEGINGMILKNFAIQQTLSVEFEKTLPAPIQQTLSVELEKFLPIPTLGTLSPELQEGYPIPSDVLLSRLSFSHFLEIMRKDEPIERLFYEVETIKNNWSVRELERAMDTALYIRTGLSKNKEEIIRKFKNQKPAQPAAVIRDPYIMEFFGIEEQSKYNETELEELILNHLQKFLIELGAGFCFEARQKRITFDNTHYRIDLVFYHRILKSHILIDLKIGKFDHADAGQMNVYLNYYRENEMSENDNPPVGLILCGDKSKTLAKYATAGMDNQLFVSKYLVNLPKKEALEEFIRRELRR